MKITNLKIVLIAGVVLFLIALLTVPADVLDATDVKDYTDTAKFFAGEYSAKQRAAHSVMYGLLLSPLVMISESFLLVKLSSAFWLLLLILSVYYISGKSRKTLILITALPLIWFMSPWISPVPLVSIFFVWAYYFIKKFENTSDIKYIALSGVLIGLAGAFWATSLYLSVFFIIGFFYDKKLYYAGIFVGALILGFLPALIIDQLFFGFAFFSLIKHISSALVFFLYNGIYGQGYSSTLGYYILFIIYIPFYFFLLYKRENIKTYKRELIFLSLSFLFLILNPQIRLILPLAPIVILLISNKLNEKQFRKQIKIFVVLSLIAISPYAVQTVFDSNERYLEVAVLNLPEMQISLEHASSMIRQDLAEIEKEYPNEIFVVGNRNDDYRKLAHYYWGDGIKEFVSIEDYTLYSENKTDIMNMEISSDARIDERREIWIGIGIRKNSNDKTDYEGIDLGIGVGEPLEIEGFAVKKKYGILYLSEKID